MSRGKKRMLVVAVLSVLAVLSSTVWAREGRKTPMLPGTPWHVHDMNRPQPKVVTPDPSKLPKLPVPPPKDAIVLFDGTPESMRKNWTNPKWKVEDGAMYPPRKAGYQVSRRAFGDIQLHLEFMTDPADTDHGQARSNSGVFLMGLYEIQVLDNYRNKTYPDGQCGAVYGQTPPRVNACLPPGQWQSYDITFHAPRFKNGKLVKPAEVTVYQNGILVQDHTKILGPTRHGRLPVVKPHPDKLPLKLQDHGNPVRYRNIWVKEL